MQTKGVFDCNFHSPGLFEGSIHITGPDQNNFPAVAFKPADKTFNPDGAEVIGASPEGGDEQGFQNSTFQFSDLGSHP